MPTSLEARLDQRLPLPHIDRLMLAWWCLNALVFAHVVLAGPPLWVTYAYNVGLYLVGGFVATLDRTVRRIFVIGTVAGVVELGVDAFLVDVTGTLVYPTPESPLLTILIRSPAYMPLAWAILITQVGYLAHRIEETWGRVAAATVPAAVAVVLLSVYESGAGPAGIWEYVAAPLGFLGNAPFFILTAEAAMFVALPSFLRWRSSLAAGVGFGLWISACYVASYYLFVAVASIV
ncbi:hypothetical protein [Halolamina sp.]|jgi:hypothetical protein|uniref:DUF6989 domain-containing protein n=1 Tax=Halolamina sp. TaxID=1940283 RepID=UPI000223B9A3|nr:hypothetical protein Halar_1539 [halophilic archaeon DL31]